jgi:hypothetical protein
MNTSRRAFLTRAGLGAGALTIGSALIPMHDLLASAQDATAAKPDDTDIAAFAQTLELAAANSHTATGASGKISVAAAQVLAGFAAHHVEHAKAFAAIAGSKATGKPNAKLADTLAGQLRDAQNETMALRIAADLENALAATYLYEVGAFTSVSARQLAASVLPVEAQHGTVVGQLLGLPISTDVPNLESQDLAIDMTKFPATSTTTTSTSTTVKK